MPDAHDFLTFLGEHTGKVVTVEVGVRADDLPNHSRQGAVFYGVMGPVQMADDEDRAGRAVAWVPVGSQEGQRMGFYVESDRTTEVVVHHIGSKIWFEDDHYVCVMP